jgi:choline dehydrogenase-like flavoprotein
MIDQIIPATDTPGAEAARVDEFIDVILTEWANDEERQNFLNGIADVDKQSNQLYAHDFAAASPAQQLVLLRSMDQVAAIQVFQEMSPPGLAIHEMGTARMGRDPKTSVLNARNQAHDVKNLFVTDGGCMTSSSCVNPSLTYMAFTARATISPSPK